MKKHIGKIITLFILSALIVPLAEWHIHLMDHSVYAARKEPVKSTEVSLVINYGQEVTENNSVILEVKIQSNESIMENMKIQFSVDNKSWYGYNNNNNKWIYNHYGLFQNYYANFNIGSNGGLIHVYVRILDDEHRVIGQGKSQIIYSPMELSPIINEPVSKQWGGGTHNYPYYIKSPIVALDLEIPNGNEVTYSVDGVHWAPWEKIYKGHIYKKITFDNEEGLKKVYVKAKNQWGIESTIKTIYYLLDKTPPSLEIKRDDGAFTVDDGNIEFEISLYDGWSQNIQFKIELSGNGIRGMEEGNVSIFEKGRATSKEASISDLPKGTYRLKVTAQDQGGNVSVKSVNIVSKN